jgi:hypothetical protein
MGLSIRRVFSFVILFLTTGVTPAFAQLCAGQPAFSRYDWQASLGIPITKDIVVNGLTTSLGTGRDALFAIGLGRFVYPRGAGSAAISLGLNVGSDITLSRTLRVHVCPMVTGIQTWGPDQKRINIQNGLRETVVDVSTASWAAGARVGWILSDTPGRQIGPTVGVRVLRERTSRKPVAGAGLNSTDTYGIAEAGLTFILNEQAALTPTVSIPFKSDTAQVEFLVLMTFGFGMK